jgi:hypothetical protein
MIGEVEKKTPAPWQMRKNLSFLFLRATNWQKDRSRFQPSNRSRTIVNGEVGATFERGSAKEVAA